MELHVHCLACVNHRCIARPQPGISCDLVTCPLVCGAAYHACKGSEHRLLCPLERVPCLNSGFGCPAHLLRKRMSAHLEVCPAGVVCCTMERNRWPISCLDYTSYESLSRGMEEVEQLDMALALQDQRTLLESLKVVAMAPTVEREACVAAELARDGAERRDKPMDTDPMASTSGSLPTLPCQRSPGSAKEKITNGINGLKEEHYSKLYEATVETARSLAAALGVLNGAHSADGHTESPSKRAVPEERESSELTHGLPSRPDENAPAAAEGAGLQEGYGHFHEATQQLRSLVSALVVLGSNGSDSDPSCRAPSDEQAGPSGGPGRRKATDDGNVATKDSAVELAGDLSAAEVGSAVTRDVLPDCGAEDQPSAALCNGCLSRERDQDERGLRTPDAAHASAPGNRGSTQDAGSALEGQVQLTDAAAQGCWAAPSLGSPLLVTRGVAQRASHVLREDRGLVVMEDRGPERRFLSQQALRGLGQFTLSSGRRGRFSDRPLYRFRPKMEDKAVDTSDLEQEEDPMGLGEIDLITAALLFCVEESRECRRISDTVFVDGYHVDFGTQTFTFPAAILVTSTRVGDMASASACDHAAPQLSYPSPFRTLRLGLVLGGLEVPELPHTRWLPPNRVEHKFPFVCGQLFRRDEFSSHFMNVHGDIHAGLNGWMEHRCPLAYYGCTYSQRRFSPSTKGAKVIHDRHLRSFGVQPSPALPIRSASQSDQLSGLPFEVMRHIAGFLDSFSLCQLSMVSRTMRDVCGSLLQARGIVELQWERRQYPNLKGTVSWQIKERVWRFSSAFSPVHKWCFADHPNMSDHLGKCRFNTVERKMEAVPLPSMCTARDGRSLRQVLKLHEQHN